MQTRRRNWVLITMRPWSLHATSEFLSPALQKIYTSACQCCEVWTPHKWNASHGLLYQNGNISQHFRTGLGKTMYCRLHMTHPQPDTHFCIHHWCQARQNTVVNAAISTMADSDPPDARKLADSIDSSSPWQDAKNDTKKLEAEPTLMEFDTLDGGGLVAATSPSHHVCGKFETRIDNCVHLSVGLLCSTCNSSFVCEVPICLYYSSTRSV
jgi:hypothetical protein